MSRRASRFVTLHRAAKALKTDFEHVMDLYSRYKMPKRVDPVHGLKVQVKALRVAMERDAQDRLGGLHHTREGLGQAFEELFGR